MYMFLLEIAVTIGAAVSSLGCQSREQEEVSNVKNLEVGDIQYDAGWTHNSKIASPGGLYLLQSDSTGRRFLNICLDRESFLNRGFTDVQLGRWPNNKSGVFLSLFNAVQANNPNEMWHAWYNSSLPDFHRGIAAHIDYWVKEFHGKSRSVYYYAYDSLNAGTVGCQVRLVARSSGEDPFNGSDGCGGPNVIGCYAGDDRIFINASSNWVTGLTTVDPAYVSGQMNMTFVIAHELGHFLGFDHSDDLKSIMFPSLKDGQNWQVGGLIEIYAKSQF